MLKWTNVTDEWPEKHKNVIVYYKPYREDDYKVGVGYYKKGWVVLTEPNAIQFAATVIAWMPLPNPPEVEDGKFVIVSQKGYAPHLGSPRVIGPFDTKRGATEWPVLTISEITTFARWKNLRLRPKAVNAQTNVPTEGRITAEGAWIDIPKQLKQCETPSTRV